MQAEVIGNLLKPPERDPGAGILQLGQRGGRHAEQAGLLAQAHPGLGAQPPDALSDERDELVIRAL